MARQELKKPIDLLYTEKNSIDKRLTELNDRFTLLGEQLTSMRQEQFSCREAIETLPNSNSSKPAKAVFAKRAAELQLEINKQLKEIEVVEKDRVVWKEKGKAMEKSIRELQQA